MARADGIANLTLRAVAERVGMRAPSLYSHFTSKHAIYDAMFGQAWHAFDDAVAGLELPQHPREALRALAHQYVTFSVADLARHQLMDQRVIPDFTPSPQNLAPAVRVLERLRRWFEQTAGAMPDDDVDLFVALVAGVVATQWSNDPGGTRYVRQLDRAVDMLADEFGLPTASAVPARPEQEQR